MSEKSSREDAHLIETKLDSELVYDGGFLKVRRDAVRLPNGRDAWREYIVHPGAVVVIAQLDDGRVLVERQHRYPVGRVMTELPAGKLDPGEEPLVCAQRELFEETGYTASQWAHAGALHIAIAYSTEIIHIFFARGMKAGERRLDEDEFLDVGAMTLPELLAASREGRITDAKTLTCLLWLQNVAAGTWQLDWQDA
ncbi:NUDIX domain-containing protein [Bordetella sp. FB-8]|uniref:NUDIX domain-containing protein n=1 Tax=Bordetella sp. FB-8 TaxID=1159870 RepID=UPI00037B9A42|nr:NUDIX hydrolase [Bordetella sp. FB-8]